MRKFKYRISSYYNETKTDFDNIFDALKFIQEATDVDFEVEFVIRKVEVKN